MRRIDGTDRDKLIEMLRGLIESKCQAEHDFGGEQRNWHLPRLRAAFAISCQLFPSEMVAAMDGAKDPYGNALAGE